MNKIKAMSIFAAVVEHGSFSRAAHALSVGIASVSDYVAMLEKEVGVRLLDRTTRALAPTPAGTAYYHMCRRLLTEMEETESQLLSGALGVSGPVRVQLPDHVLQRLVLPFLGQFHEAHPAVTLQFQCDDSFETARGLVDLTFRSALPFEKHPPRGAIPIGKTRAVLVASPAYLKKYGNPAHPSQLKDHRCIGFTDPESGRLWEWYFAENGEPVRVDPRCWVRINRGIMLIDAVLQGLGLATELECNVQAFLARGELEIVLPEWAPLQSIGSILYDRTRELSSQARIFLDYFLNSVKQAPYIQVESIDR